MPQNHDNTVRLDCYNALLVEILNRHKAALDAKPEDKPTCDALLDFGEFIVSKVDAIRAEEAKDNGERTA